MSAIKRYYEDLTDIVTEAVYEECFDMPDYLEADRARLWDETFQQIINDPYGVYSYMEEILADKDHSEMPMTVKALNAMKQIITDNEEISENA